MNKADSATIKKDWTTSGYDPYMSKQQKPDANSGYISGANFDIQLDEMMFNRMIQFKNLYKTPQGNSPGKVYYDKDKKKLYMWIDKDGKWAEILYTTSSTSTTSTSSSTS